MSLEIVRADGLDPRWGVTFINGAERGNFDDAYVLLRNEKPCWQAAISWGDDRNVPFRGQLIWTAGRVAVIGGGSAVHFLDLDTGAIRLTLSIPCLFSRIALDMGESPLRAETLYVLGWTDIVAIAPELQPRWWARDVAVDGIEFLGAQGAMLRFGVEMDPPGGWFEIELDALSGQELSRKPSFEKGYVGIYSALVK